MACSIFKVKLVDYVYPVKERKFTIGKVYEVKNNCITADNGEEFISWSFDFNGNADFEALRKWFRSWYVFELVEDKKVFTKKDLKTGMFGYFDNETDDWFVIVGDRFIYQRGSGDDVCKINDDLTMPSGRKITALYNGMSFNHAKRSGNAPIWKREKEKPLYNGKVVCIGNSSGNRSLYTIGKIYQFKEGVLIADNGSKITDMHNNPFHSFNEFTDFSCSEWLEVVE